MTKIFRVFAVLGILSLPFTLIVAGAASAQVQEGVSIADIVGDYKVSGRNPDGSAYSGSLTLSEGFGAALLEWSVASRSYSGEGNFVGNVLVVNWGAKHPVIYTIDANGNLAGTWAGGLASEKLTRR